MSKIVEEWRPVVGYEGLYEEVYGNSLQYRINRGSTTSI